MDIQAKPLLRWIIQRKTAAGMAATLSSVWDLGQHPVGLGQCGRQMVMGTLYEFLKREKLDRLIALFPELVDRTILDGETAYGAILNRRPDRQPWDQALSDLAQKRICAVIEEWRRVRPILEPFARYPERLAALPENSG